LPLALRYAILPRAAQCDQRAVVGDVAVGSFTDHGGLHAVVKDLDRHATDGAESQHVTAQPRLATLKDRFQKDDQIKIEAAARKSEIIHFLRVLVLQDKFFVVLTEYDRGHKEYAEFFRIHLNDLFKEIFSIADLPVNWDSVNNEKDFYEASKKFQVRSLGETLYGETDPDGKPEGYLFSAYENRSVEDILSKLK
jgi:hypothetical protein